MLSKNTILKAIHNENNADKGINTLRMLSKNTILKAIHNTKTTINSIHSTANAK